MSSRSGLTETLGSRARRRQVGICGGTIGDGSEMLVRCQFEPML